MSAGEQDWPERDGKVDSVCCGSDEICSTLAKEHQCLTKLPTIRWIYQLCCYMHAPYSKRQ